MSGVRAFTFEEALPMSTDHAFVLRPLAEADLAAAHGLSLAVRWPHRLEDWHVMFGLGRGVAAWDSAGHVAGVAMWWPQGEDFATLGMVIVSPALQKAGLGRRLMAAIVEAAGKRRIGLNATAEGRRLYRSFGFEDVGGIHQHNGVPTPSASPAGPASAVRPMAETDRDALLALDRAATGVDRTAMLGTLLPLSRGFVLDGPDGLAGTLLVRDFGRGKLLGPLVAQDEAAALALVSHAAARMGGFLRMDIPDDASLLARWLEEAGLSRVGEVRTMLRGGRPALGGGAHVFGLASQALG